MKLRELGVGDVVEIIAALPGREHYVGKVGPVVAAGPRRATWSMVEERVLRAQKVTVRLTDKANPVDFVTWSDRVRAVTS